MIKSLNFKNFRSYKNITFHFHKRINAIIGDGLAGKSNVLRGIKLLNTYRPNKKYLSHFVPINKTTKISLKTSEEAKVTLFKNNKGSTYKTINRAGERQSFRKFGNTVPLEVKNILNLNDINFQYQLDAPYIISNSPGQITKIINEITKVDSVDLWIKLINTKLKFNNTLLKSYEEEYNEIQKKITTLKKTKKLEPIIKNLYTLKKTEEKLKEKQYKIHLLIAKINKIKVKNKLIDKIKYLDLLINKIKNTKEKKENFKIKKHVIASLLKHEKNIIQLKLKFKAYKKTYINKLKKRKQCPTCLSDITSLTIKKITKKI